MSSPCPTPGRRVRSSSPRASAAEIFAAPAVPSEFQAAPAEIPAVPATATARDYLEDRGLIVPADNVYYKNCTEARKAGAAPILRGEPGYRPALDRDNDGV